MLLKKEVQIGNLPRDSPRSPITPKPIVPTKNKDVDKPDTGSLTKIPIDISRIIQPTGITTAVPSKGGVSTQTSGSGNGVWSKVLDFSSIVFSNADKIITGLKSPKSTVGSIPSSAVPFTTTPPISPSGVYQHPDTPNTENKDNSLLWIIGALIVAKLLKIF